MLSQLVDVTDSGLIHTLLHHWPDGIVNRTGWRSGELDFHMSGARKSGVLRGSISIVSRARCDGRCLDGKWTCFQKHVVGMSQLLNAISKLVFLIKSMRGVSTGLEMQAPYSGLPGKIWFLTLLLKMLPALLFSSQHKPSSERSHRQYASNIVSAIVPSPGELGRLCQEGHPTQGASGDLCSHSAI